MEIGSLVQIDATSLKANTLFIHVIQIIPYIPVILDK